MLKRLLSALLATLMCMLALMGCKNNNYVETPEEITSFIKENTSAEIVWTSISPDNVISHLGFDGRIASDSSVFINETEGTVNIVASFRFNTKEKLLQATAAINEALTKAAQTYKNVDITQADKLTNRIIMYKENTLVLVATENSEKIEELLNERNWKTPK